VADGRRRCGRNCGRGAGSDSGPDWISRGAGHNRNFTGNYNRHVTGYDHAGLNADPGNDATRNCKPDPGYGKSDARNGNTCAGNDTGDSPDNSNSGNDSGSLDSGNKPHDADSGDHPGDHYSGNCASCG